MSTETIGGNEVELEVWPLADGTEVSSAAAMSAWLSLEALLEEHGAVAAIDLVDVANGKQPNPSPFADMKSILVDIGLCSKYEDGSIGMHRDTAAVVRNAVHVNPQDAFDWRLTDPRQPFGGFDSPAQV